MQTRRRSRSSPPSWPGSRRFRSRWVLFFGLQGALRRDVHRRRLEDVGERVAVARRRGLAVLSVLAGVGTIYVLAGGSSIEWGHLGRHNPGELLFLGTA